RLSARQVPRAHASVRPLSCCSGAPRDLHSFPTRRSSDLCGLQQRIALTQHPVVVGEHTRQAGGALHQKLIGEPAPRRRIAAPVRSEEHTSELQSRENLVCRLLLEKKKKHKYETETVGTSL